MFSIILRTNIVLYGMTGLVTSLVAKRDVVLAGAIEEAIGKGLPIDALTSDKKDYTVSMIIIVILSSACLSYCT